MTPRQRAWLLPPAALFLSAGILLGRGMSSSLHPLLACLAALCAAVLLRGRLRFAACMALALALGAVSGQSAWHPSLPPEGDYQVRGIISDEIRPGHYGQIRTALTHVSLNGRPLNSDAYWSFYLHGEETLPEDFFPGREVSFTASLYAPSGAVNPDGYNFREELLRRGITVCLFGSDGLAVSAPSGFSFAGAAASLRARLTALLIDRMGEEAGGYTAALLLGNRSLIPSEDRSAFSRLGIAHILAVSGFHTGILILLLSALFRLLRLSFPVRLVLYGVILLLYCALCGMSVPVVRASALLMLNLWGKHINRPRIGLHLTCAVMILMLLWSPVQLTGISFLLTFGAVLGIFLLMPYLESLCPFSGKRLSRLWSACSLALAAHLGVLLPELYFYQKLPLLGLLVNLPASLFASLLLAVDWVVLLLLPVPFLCALPAAAGTWLTSLLVRGVKAVSALPGIALWTHASTLLTAAGMVLVFVALCALLRLSRLRRILLLSAGALLVCLSLFPGPHHETEYIQFSVGNADAAVLWDRDSVFVVDTGTDDGVLSGFLRRNRLIPDAVILTHLHTDHAGGLRSVLDDEIPVPLLYLPAGAEEQAVDEEILPLLEELRASGTEIRHLSRGDVLSLPSGSLSVLWPEAGYTRPGQDANRYSLAALLSLKGTSMLLTGDLTGDYESYAALRADLLKAAHHGSPESTSESFLSLVDPQAVLLSCGRVSRHESFSQRVAPRPVWSTAVHGALTVRFLDNAFTLTPWLSHSESGGI